MKNAQEAPMTDRLPNIPAPRYDGDKDKNEDRSTMRWRKKGVDAGYPCFICGTFTGPNPALMIHLCDGGASVADVRALDDADHDASGCLAAYPIGGSCLKKFPQLRKYAFDPRTQWEGV